VKPVIGVLWVLSIALAVGLTRLTAPTPTPYPAGSDAIPSYEEVFAEFDPLRRAYLLSHALVHLGSDNLPELLTVLERGQAGIDSEQVRLIMLAWARFDAPGAYEWALRGPKSWRGTLIDNALFAWAYYDGRAAVSMAEGIEDPEVMVRRRSSVLDGWMRSDDKQGVSEYIAVFPDLKRRGRLFFLISGEVVMSEGVDGAMRWVDGLPDDLPNDMKLGVFHHVAKMVAQEDPVLAVDWFLEHHERPYSDGALNGIVLRWMQHHDRPAGMTWLLAVDSDDLRPGERDKAMAQAFRSWMQIDPEAAQSWLLTRLPNPELDPAITETFKRLLPTDPAKSMEWTLKLDDEKARRREAIKVGTRWRNWDPEGFKDWLEQNDLPDEIGQKISAAPQVEFRRKRKPKPAAASKP